MTDTVNDKKHLPFCTLSGIVPWVNLADVEFFTVGATDNSSEISGLRYNGANYFIPRNAPVIDEDFLIFDDAEGDDTWTLAAIESAFKSGIIVDGKFWDLASGENIHEKS